MRRAVCGVLVLVLCAGFGGGAAAGVGGRVPVLAPPEEASRGFDYGDLPHRVGPEAGLFGLPLGASLDEALAHLGPANGLVQLGDGRNALFYGRKLVLIFRDGLLVRAGSPMPSPLTYTLDAAPHPFFDKTEWVIGPGIRRGMGFEEVAERLGRTDAQPAFRMEFEADNGVGVALEFASRSSNFLGSDYVLHGFWLRGAGVDGPVSPYRPAPPGESLPDDLR